MSRSKLSWFGAALVLLAATASPAGAQGYGYRPAAQNGLRLRLGLFTPEGGSAYWAEKTRDFTGEPDDFEDVTFGVEYQRELMPMLHLLIGGSFFAGEQDQAYRDFEDDLGRPIVHTTALETASFDAGFRLDLAPADLPLVPYVGAGGKLVSWQLSEDGDFIDFSTVPPEIFTDFFEADGTAVGYFLLLGLEVPVGHFFSFFAEGRWHEVNDDLGDDFEDFGDLDLSGRELAAGVSWRF
jgi:hypothetical protein